MKLVKTTFGGRMIVSTPIALAITIGLGLTMAGLINSDFELNDNKGKKLSFEISTRIDDPVLPDREIIIEDIFEVFVPPPPPVMTEQDWLPPKHKTMTVKEVVLDIKDITIKREIFSIAVSDEDAQPIVRIPPGMPPRAERSGHCDMRFDVSAEGAPFNIQVLNCTSSVFQRASLRNVGQWKYKPKIFEKRRVAMHDVKTTIRFNLVDERGKIIPE